MIHVNEPLEKSVLGILISQGAVNDITADVIDKLRPEHFALHVNNSIYNAIYELSNSGGTFDLINLEHKLKTKGGAFYDELGGFAYLAALCEHDHLRSNLKSYADKLMESHLARVFIEKLNTASETIHGTGEIQENLNKCVSILSEVEFDSGKKSVVHAGDTMSAFIDSLEKAFTGGGLVGMETGFDKLDEHTGGFAGGDLVIVAGKPSSGKTTLALNIARKQILDRKNVLFFSAEMSTDQINQKMFADIGNVPLNLVRNGRCLDDDLYAAKLGDFIPRMRESNFHIDDTGGIHINQILSRARKHKLKHGDIDLIIVDYIQIIRADGEQRYLQVSDVSMKLKALAKEMDCPVIALSQLAKNGVGRPTGSSLRESGQIEQDADVILFLHTDNDQYKPQQGQLTELIRNKVRMGEAGTSCLINQLQYQRFVCAGEQQPPEPEKKDRF